MLCGPAEFLQAVGDGSVLGLWTVLGTYVNLWMAFQWRRYSAQWPRLVGPYAARTITWQHKVHYSCCKDDVWWRLVATIRSEMLSPCASKQERSPGTGKSLQGVRRRQGGEKKCRDQDWAGGGFIGSSATNILSPFLGLISFLKFIQICAIKVACWIQVDPVGCWGSSQGKGINISLKVRML